MRRRPRALLAALALALVVGGVGLGAQLLPPATDAPAAAAPAATAPSAADVTREGGIGNLVFWYRGSIDLATASQADVRRTLGRPAIVVAQRGDDEPAVTEAIHRNGAKAYRYVQFFWTPTDRDYDGLDLGQHPEWAYCSRGDTPALGVRDSDGDSWAFLDANEQGVHEHFRAKFAAMKAAGWDGVFIDRGEAATTYAEDTEGHAVWARPSTCTDEPVRAGAAFSDAFVDMIGLAHEAGLRAIMNNGRPAFDPVIPMRPEPTDPDCRTRAWAACSHRNDVWRNVDLALAETATRPRDVLWDRTFAANRQAERSISYSRRAVALVTTSAAGGTSRREMYYAWSRIKLFDLSVGINTGNDRCPGSTGTICNRYGVYPELASIRWGSPKGDGPAASNCVRGSDHRCVWRRHYQRGIDLVNVRPFARQVRVSTRTGTCRYVWDVANDRPLGGNACQKTFTLRMGAWAGRPLLLSTSPWP